MKPLAETKFPELAARASRLATLPAETPARRRLECQLCGQSMPRSQWACDDCAAKERAARRESLLARARASIPDKFQWARWAAPELASRVGASPAALSAAFTALRGESPVVTIQGGSGAGKTTLACALLNHVIDAGAVLTCSAETLERARFAFFADAVDLSLSRQESRFGTGAPGDITRARNASVLVVDEFGKDDKRSGDVAKVIHHREAHSLVTIVTTWLTQDEIKAAYDGAMARRLFDKAVVFNLKARV